MMPTCQSGVDLLMDYLENALPTDVRVELEQHVLGCTRCRAFIETYRQTPGVIRNATTVSFPLDLGRTLQEFLRARLPGGKEL